MRLRYERSGMLIKQSEAEAYQLFNTTTGATAVDAQGTRLRGYGTSRIVARATVAHFVELDHPSRKGVVKRIVVKPAGFPITVVCRSTLSQIAGSTYNTIVFSTQVAPGRHKSVELVAATSRNWDLVAISTGITLTKTSSPYA